MLNVDGEPLVAIPIDSFMSGSNSKADIFVKMGPTKAIKVVKEGQAFDLDRLRNYQDHDVDHLLVKKSSYKNYLDGCLSIVRVLADNEKCSAEVIVKTSEAVLVEVFEVDFLPHTFTHVVETATAMTKSLANTPGIEDLIKLIEKINEETYRHLVATSYLSTLTANKLGWRNQKNLQLVSVGGYLHDIGFRVVDPALALKPRTEMSKEETTEYEKHPIAGADEMRKVAPENDEVIKIIEEHHENSHGTGFPHGLARSEIFPLSSLVSLCDQLANLMITSSKNPEPKSPSSAIKYLELKLGSDYPQEYWQALSRLLV